MIQRIQSIHLFLAAVLMGVMFLFPLGRFLGGAEQFHLTALGITSSTGARVVYTMPMAIFIAASALLPLIIIFLYKKRPQQLRLCIMELFLVAATQLVVCIYLWRTTHIMAGFGPHASAFSVAVGLPVVAFIFVWLAATGIRRDEKKVRSLDRIR